MLNYLSKLSQTVNLKNHEEFINGLKPFVGSQWDSKCDEMVQLKKYIHSELERYQKRRCAYCGLEYTEVAYTNIEHIAPKKQYPQFMFEPFNLVASCPKCNGFAKKGNINTISHPCTDYKKCVFIFVHPYLDNPNEHFEFINEIKGIVICPKTNKGKMSVKIFDLNGGYMLEQRAKQFVSMNTTSTERYHQICEILSMK